MSVNMPTQERQECAQARVDTATSEAVQLALDSMYDYAIHLALVRRVERERLHKDNKTCG
jgi:hypothetical protein